MPEFPIHNETEISAARYFLRRRIGGNKWTPNSRARAVAAMTAIAELLLTVGTSGNLHVSISHNGDQDILKLSCSSKLPDDQHIIESISSRLQQVSNALEFSVTGSHAQISAKIWEAGQQERFQSYDNAPDDEEVGEGDDNE